MKAQVKALVCGANFGKFYLQACNNSKQIALTGLLSRGSENSQALAKAYKIPLFTDVTTISNNQADIAVIAAKSLITGGKSSQTVKQLLQQGVSVLQEQPVHAKEAVEISQSIRNENQIYCVNNFYRFLPAVQRFVQYAKQLSRTYPILRLSFRCASQVLYALIDVLYELFDGIHTFDVTKILDGNRSVLAGTLNAIPFVFHYYNEYAADIDGSLAIFFDIQLDTPAGNLILNDPEGEVLWQSHLQYNRDADFSAKEFQMLQPLEVLFDGKAKNYAQKYREIWPQAMAQSILNGYQNTLQAETAKQTVQRTLAQCAYCLQITTAAGRPKKIEIPYRTDLTSFDRLKHDCVLT